MIGAPRGLRPRDHTFPCRRAVGTPTFFDPIPETHTVLGPANGSTSRCNPSLWIRGEATATHHPALRPSLGAAVVDALSGSKDRQKPRKRHQKGSKRPELATPHLACPSATSSENGAQEGTRTLTPYGTRPSNVCVYQFHHLSDSKTEEGRLSEIGSRV